MADPAKLAKAKRELEELYLGIPDDSVNLTFGDLADLKPTGEKRKSGPLEPLTEVNRKKEETAPLAKQPSLDFSRGFQAITHHLQPHQLHHVSHDSVDSFSHHHYAAGNLQGHGENHHHLDHHGSVYGAPRRDMGLKHAVDNSIRAYDEMRDVSGISMVAVGPGGGRRRPGIPHSNICTVCSTYIYIFRHRCLVCGRAYCRHCVGIGMGDMTEGRKCIQCLGRKFSQRYIQRAGQVGCCMKLRYPAEVFQQELKWAEKGPRRSGEGRSGQSAMMSRSRSPMNPPRAHHASPGSGTPSFVMKSPYSAYSPTNHPLPF
ncbi:hypothetical protein NMG60_11034338 [Bertholletia excelsa]